MRGFSGFRPETARANDAHRDDGQSAAAALDPYHSWLGIPPDEQPPNHYRLLGITPCEPEPEVIRNAADQRMTYLKTFAVGRHSEVSQRLLNEVSAVTVCLLNTEKKRQYDNKLRKHVVLPRRADPIGPVHAPHVQTPPRRHCAPPEPRARRYTELPNVASPRASDSNLRPLMVTCAPRVRPRRKRRLRGPSAWAVSIVLTLLLFILGDVLVYH